WEGPAGSRPCRYGLATQSATTCLAAPATVRDRSRTSAAPSLRYGLMDRGRCGLPRSGATYKGGQPFDVAQEPPSAHLRRVRQHRAVPRVDLLPGLTEARGPREGLSVGGRRGVPGGLGLIAAG